jgi:hypothetical protein
MSPEDYIATQCEAFEKTLLDMGVSRKFEYSLDSIKELDLLKESLWGGSAPAEELGNAVSIMWGAVLTRIIARAYVSQWQVDPESNLPVVVVKCGNKGMQVRSIVYGAQAFNNDESFIDIWRELEKTLGEADAEKV